MVLDMIREFVLTKTFEQNWESLRLDDDDLMCLQQTLLENPQIGALVKKTGGLRKMRIRLDGRGKSGGARVLYIDFVSYEKIYLISAYSKARQDNLSDEESWKIKQLIESLEKELIDQKERNNVSRYY